MKPRVDTHCHFINFNYLPDKYTTHLLANQSKLLARIMHEDDFRAPDLLEQTYIKIAKRLGVKYVDKFLNSMRVNNFWGKGGVIHNLVETGEYFVNEDFEDLKLDINNFKKISLYTPLMMDFIRGADISNIESTDGVAPFLLQWYEHTLLARTYPWKVMPFFHFHPERKHVVEICKEAIEQFGYIGVKMYPAMGFYPDCDHGENKQLVNDNLRKLYEYLQELREDDIVIPITAHSQYSSTQSIKFKMPETMKYTNISNWENVIKTYDLKINFAHYGGNEYLEQKDSEVKTFSLESRTKIRELMETYNKDGNKQIFADTAAHSGAFGDYSDTYFENLINDLGTDTYLVMFGTDMPVITPNMLNIDYVKAYEEGIEDPSKIDKLFSDNPLDFLFHQKTIPANYIKFLETSVRSGFIDADPLGEDRAEWVTSSEDGKKYILKTPEKVTV